MSGVNETPNCLGKKMSEQTMIIACSIDSENISKSDKTIASRGHYEYGKAVGNKRHNNNSYLTTKTI